LVKKMERDEWSVVTLSRDDIVEMGKRMGINDLTEEEFERIAQRVKKGIERNDMVWDVYWDAIRIAVAEVVRERG